MARQTSGQAGGSQSTNQDAPVIVAIGASAGGIQVLQKLFRTMPHQTGAAYVVVVHLDPHGHSDLPHILAACTPIPVVQVEGTEKIEADHRLCHPARPPPANGGSPDLRDPVRRPHGLRSPIDLFSGRLPKGLATASP
jgi:two-component system CheB/CheR fusion protein